MSNAFAAGKRALGICDRCGQTFKLRELRGLTVKLKPVNMLVCGACWEPDQPQLQVGMYPVSDPQALRNPRPDTASGAAGDYSSRDFQWGWAPAGGAYAGVGTPNNLVSTTSVGTVTIATT